MPTVVTKGGKVKRFKYTESGKKAAAAAANESIYTRLEDLLLEKKKKKKGKKWIQKAVKHPGRCTPMPNPDCPVGSPQYNLGKRFKKAARKKKKKGGSGWQGKV